MGVKDRLVEGGAAEVGGAYRTVEAPIRYGIWSIIKNTALMVKDVLWEGVIGMPVAGGAELIKTKNPLDAIARISNQFRSMISHVLERSARNSVDAHRLANQLINQPIRFATAIPTAKDVDKMGPAQVGKFTFGDTSNLSVVPKNDNSVADSSSKAA